MNLQTEGVYMRLKQLAISFLGGFLLMSQCSLTGGQAQASTTAIAPTPIVQNILQDFALQNNVAIHIEPLQKESYEWLPVLGPVINDGILNSMQQVRSIASSA